MKNVIDIPVQKPWAERLTELKIKGELVISMRHYRTVTSKFSSRDFRFKYPDFAFKSSVDSNGQTFTVTRLA